MPNTREQIREFFKSPSSRFERGGMGVTIQPELTFRAVQIYLRETMLRERNLHDYVNGPDDGDWITHIKTGMVLLDAADRAERSSNGLLLDVRIHNQNSTRLSDFGLLLHRAGENPQNSHHNADHDRRIEELGEGILVNTPALRRMKGVLPWIDSMMLALRWHDKDQLLSIERNHEREKRGEKALKEKLGHGLGAAVMLLALHKRYAKEAGLSSVSEAWRRCAGAAAMILHHEEPELYAASLSGRRKAWSGHGHEKKLYFGEVLEQLYDKRELDIFSISPKQILQLLRMKKFRDEGFRENSTWGLTPEFETEYARELEDLFANDEPLLRDVIENPELFVESRQGFDVAARIFVRSDQAEMYLPIEESIMRKLATQLSHLRPFWRPRDKDELLLQILHGVGNLPSDEDDDVRRILWELVHMNSLGNESVEGQSPHVLRINREGSIVGVLAFQEIAHRIMRGDTSDIGRIMLNRVWTLSRKGLKKSGCDQFQIHTILKGTGKRYVEDIVENVFDRMHSKDPDMAAVYRKKVYTLLEQTNTILASLHKDELYDVHSDEADIQIAVFDEVIDSVLEHLCREYNVNEKQLRKLWVKVKKRQFPELPYKTYDSLGSYPRTLIPPRDLPTQ